MNLLWPLGRAALRLALSLAGRALQPPSARSGDGSGYLLLAGLAAAALLAGPGILLGALAAGLAAPGP